MPFEMQMQVFPNVVRVLVVDDSAAQRRFYRTVLETAGVMVTEAENGAIALSALQKTDFYAVILDMKMPVMGGVEVLERLFSEDWPSIPPEVIVSSSEAHDMAAQHEDLFMSARAVLEKPVAPTTLLEALTSAVRARKARVGG